MNRVYIGIDPGETGALVAIFIDGTQDQIHVYDYQVDGNTSSALQALQNIANEAWNFSAMAMIERQWIRPGQAAKGMGSLMTNFGRWIGRLETLGIPYTFVVAKTWQKAMFANEPKILKKDGKLDTKKMSLAVSRKLFPSVADRLSRAKDNGRSDALLIAEYCRRVDVNGPRAGGV